MKAILLILFACALSLNVNALAVASDYLESDTLELIEGTSKIYGIRLQNTDSSEIRIRVAYDNQYMEALDYEEEYIVPPKSTIGVKFNVTAPEYVKNTNEFHISYTVHQVSGPGASGVGFLPKINKNFKLKVAKDPNRLHINYFYVAYAAILILIVFFLYKKSSSKHKFK